MKCFGIREFKKRKKQGKKPITHKHRPSAEREFKEEVPSLESQEMEGYLVELPRSYGVFVE